MGKTCLRTTFGLRHMPALREGILMRSWSSGAALLIKEWFEATPRPGAPNRQPAISEEVTGFARHFAVTPARPIKLHWPAIFTIDLPPKYH
jgi:hypothetical protein